MITDTAGTTLLDIKQIEHLFTQYDHQGEVLVQLYKTIYPDWDNIELIHGYPTVSTTTWEYICELFIDFDKEHHPGVMAGGIWLNTGWDTSHNMDDWIVDFSTAKIQYKEGV